MAINFVKYTPDYDSLSVPSRGRKRRCVSMRGTGATPEYTREQLERGETYDEMWNAAQWQMTRYGWMHNYMRMYWAKKILEWAPTPQKAFEWTGIYERQIFSPMGAIPMAMRAWRGQSRASLTRSMGGERPIFGKIRFYVGRVDGEEVRFEEIYSG